MLFAGMHPPMTVNLIRLAARTISPKRPIKMLMNLHRIPRPTAKSWYSCRRRSPIWVLEHLRHMVAVRGATDLEQQFDHLIRQRLNEPKRRTGFHLVRERDGPGSTPRDGRNRMGRPKKTIC
jgi:hypothetical protein